MYGSQALGENITNGSIPKHRHGREAEIQNLHHIQRGLCVRRNELEESEAELLTLYFCLNCF